MTKFGKRVLIIGGVAGGASCAARVRRLCEDCEIIIFEKGAFVSFANCGLPYFIGDVIVEEEKLLVATPELFQNRFNIRVCTETEVTAIHKDKKHIEVTDLNTGKSRFEPYDALVISTGATAIWPDIKGIDLPGIQALRTIPDSRKIKTAMPSMSHAVVMGAGYLGLELAENLSKTGISVTIVQSAAQVLPTLDPEMAKFVTEHLRKNAIDVRLNCEVTEFRQNDDNSLTVCLADGESINTHAVLVSVGVKPLSTLAQQAKLQLGDFSGIRVDESMQTSDPSIWAVGDVVEVRNFITKQWQLFPLAGPANKQGRIAAAHIAARVGNAQYDASGFRYRGVQRTSVCGLFGLTVATTGVSEKNLQQADYQHYEKVYLHPGNHVGYYPGAKPVRIKLLYDSQHGRVLGAQAIGEAGVARRIDVLSTFIQMGATVYDLEEAELCYAPQFGATKDPVNLAGMIAANHLRGDHPLAKWEELVESHASVVEDQDDASRLLSLIMQDPGAQAQLVDVRTDAEFQQKHIPGAINIPLNCLRSRLDELSKEREIWVICGVGQRAYNATRILQQNGFKVKNLSGGMQTYHTFEDVNASQQQN